MRQARDTEPVRPRVLIVDDHEGFRAVARTLLQSDGLDVVGEAVDGQGALAETSDLRPDLVLLDVHLPDADGFAISELLAALPNPPVVVLISSRPITDLRSRLKSSSAAGFLAKHQLSPPPSCPSRREGSRGRSARRSGWCYLPDGGRCCLDAVASKRGAACSSRSCLVPRWAR